MGHITDLTPPLNSREVKKAWEHFVSGDDRYLDKVRPAIRESWLRSQQAGVDPAMRQLPRVLSPEELDRKCQQNVSLLAAGRMAIDLLSPRLGTFIANIADSEGNLLYCYSSPFRKDKQEEINALPGASVQESLVGTTSPGLALYLNRPVLVQGYEYYPKLGHKWAGFAVPLYSACGNILGTFSTGRYEEDASPYQLDLVAIAAEFIGKQIKSFEELTHLEVLKEFNHYLLKFPESPLLALCRQGCILALSPAMAKLVTLQPPDRLIGQPLHEMRGFRFDDIFSAAACHSPESYESFITSVQKQKVYSGTVIPIQSKIGTQAGLVVIMPSLSQSAQKKETKPSWQATYKRRDLIGHSPVFRHAVQLAQKAAEYDRSVLLIGESGTGKELFAQAIHHMSRRAPGPFVALNCGTIPKELIAAELFGYEEGAFSGALRGGKRGKIALAHQGTLLLDELEDMPGEIQLGLLRFLEEGKIVPLGSEHPRIVDVRVIAAMNTDPALTVAQGKLRLDLYHRLNQLPLFLPPLRERLEDLPLLVQHILSKEGFPQVTVSPEAMEILRRYPWPGNVRELQNTLVRAAILSPYQVITPEDLPREIQTHNPSVFLHKTSAHNVDREQIRQALQECGGNISRTAQRLGIHRVTLHKKLRAYELR
jgi:transcriptional regulator of acetoin/glycerol metabolism